MCECILVHYDDEKMKQKIKKIKMVLIEYYSQVTKLGLIHVLRNFKT